MINWIPVSVKPPVKKGSAKDFLVSIEGEKETKVATYFNRTGCFEDPLDFETVNFKATRNGWETGWMFTFDPTEQCAMIKPRITHYAPMPLPASAIGVAAKPVAKRRNPRRARPVAKRKETPKT